jgi:hypothetical protein
MQLKHACRLKQGNTKIHFTLISQLQSYNLLQMNLNRLTTAILLLGILMSSCNTSPKKQASQGETGESKKPAISIPDFNSDSAYSFVAAQTAFGPRVPNTPAHEKCASYLIARLKSYCPDVVVQKGQVKAYNGVLLNFTNIIASFNPGTNDRVFISSHWDSRPYADHDPDPKNRNKPIDGANDGASGVGIILELARQLSLAKPPIGVDLVLFDVEDYGPPQDKDRGKDTEDFWGLGSQYWANHPHKPGYFAKFGVLLDMVGAPGATFLEEGISMQYAAGIVRNIWSAANRIGYSDFFLFEEGPYITDDHLYVNRIMNIPTVDIIHLDRASNTGFYPYWHTTKDNLASIDRGTLKAVGQTLLTVVYEDK